jgi:hypothetical protein
MPFYGSLSSVVIENEDIFSKLKAIDSEKNSGNA